MTIQEQFLIDHMWTLWNSLEDKGGAEIVDACVFLICHYDFDMDCLPQNLWIAIKHEMQKQEEEAYWDAEAIVVMDQVDRQEEFA